LVAFYNSVLNALVRQFIDGRKNQKENCSVLFEWLKMDHLVELLEVMRSRQYSNFPMSSRIYVSYFFDDLHSV